MLSFSLLFYTLQIYCFILKKYIFKKSVLIISKEIKEEISKRKEDWKEPIRDNIGGVLAKYSRTVTSASKGAVTT